MDETTSTRNFRENLKHFFDLARKSPIAINRGSERFVLMSETEFSKMKEELMNLQRSLISSLQHANAQTGEEIDLESDERDDHLLQEYVKKYKRLKSKKSKAG